MKIRTSFLIPPIKYYTPPESTSLAHFGHLSRVPSRFSTFLKLPLHYCPKSLDGPELRAVGWIYVFIDEIYVIIAVPLDDFPAVVATHQIWPKLHGTFMGFNER